MKTYITIWNGVQPVLWRSIASGWSKMHTLSAENLLKPVPDAAITRDMEGVKRVGISGFFIYGGSVTGKVWFSRAMWALHEANRLGLDGIVMIVATGYGPHRRTIFMLPIPV